MEKQKTTCKASSKYSKEYRDVLLSFTRGTFHFMLSNKNKELWEHRNKIPLHILIRIDEISEEKQRENCWRGSGKSVLCHGEPAEAKQVLKNNFF